MTMTPDITSPAPGRFAAPNAVKTWIDENTGREVRQLSTSSGSLGYFRQPRHLPNGLMLVRFGGHENRTLHVMDPETGQHDPVPNMTDRHQLKFRNADGVLFTIDHKARQVWAQDLINRRETLLGTFPADMPGHVSDITFDGRYLVLLDNVDNAHDKHPAPTRKDAEMFWHYIARPRRGALRVYDLQTNKVTTLLETDGYCPFHVDTCPSDPGLIRFAHDRFEGVNQRVWAIRTDGSGLRMIRPQESGELVTHEFWWSDGKRVGYTFQDRRKDPTARELPWCEYSNTKTQLGIADIDGREVYLSDPVNHYHTHLYVSNNGKLLSGSGTDGHSFVYAARFDIKSTRIDYIPLATVHTPYVPFRGQLVNCDFSADGKWLLYSDTVGDGFQLCAVRVDI
ncbi:MAG: oligogalacturonate lyase family protein [Planctomycetes bacterium]|nr:oligogalacturonate lyase family protein [Planctomycetota bacterium]